MRTPFSPTAVVLLALPWLSPFAQGPSPTVVPWLVSLALATGFMLMCALNWAAARANKTLEPAADVPFLFAWSLVLAGLISSVLALIQYADMAPFFAPWVNATQPGEAYANLRQRNQFATLTNMAVAAVMWLAMHARPGDILNQSPRTTWLFGGIALLAVGNAISSSRTGLFQLCVLGGLYAMWGGLRLATVRRLLVCSAVVYVVAMFAMPWMAGLDLASQGAFARLGKDEACGGRVMLWSNVLHLIAQKPWLGWGWGELDYAHFITLYGEPRFCHILDNAHNLPLHLAVELGVPVALAVCGGFTLWVIWQKPWEEHDGSRQMAWAVMAVILLHSMLEYPLWYGPFQIAFALCLVILCGVRTEKPNSEKPKRITSNTPLVISNIAQAAINIIAFVTLAAVAYAAWDYHRVSQIYLQPEARDAAYQQDTLAQARKSWLFADQALFAQLILMPLTPATAESVYASARHLLHYSPEPRVIEKLIESAVMLRKDAEALAYLARFQVAFPIEHAVWAKANLVPVTD